jgi:hypothetical protein
MALGNSRGAAATESDPSPEEEKMKPKTGLLFADVHGRKHAAPPRADDPCRLHTDAIIVAAAAGCLRDGHA